MTSLEHFTYFSLTLIGFYDVSYQTKLIKTNFDKYVCGLGNEIQLLLLIQLEESEIYQEPIYIYNIIEISNPIDTCGERRPEHEASRLLANTEIIIAYLNF